MSRIKFDSEQIKTFSLIQTITRTSVKDVIEEESRFVVIVPAGEGSRAIGKGAENAKRLEKKLGKKVRLIEHSASVVSFIKNLLYPLKIDDVSEEDGIIYLVPADTQTRGYIIGRNASSLRNTEAIVKRYFPIKEIKVISKA